jgi:hypothetical protein
MSHLLQCPGEKNSRILYEMAPPNMLEQQHHGSCHLAFNAVASFPAKSFMPRLDSRRTPEFADV